MIGWFGSSDHMTARGLRAAGLYVTSRVRCAARYAMLTDSSIHEAAQIFGINSGAVWNAWEQVYPETPHPTTKRRKTITCAACGAAGHIAVRGRCSPSELARRMVAGGARAIDAANRLGLTKGAVYAALEQRRRAA